jgi:hypothetical protein
MTKIPHILSADIIKSERERERERDFSVNNGKNKYTS